MEGDRFRRNRLQRQYHFNPLPPHGGRLVKPVKCEIIFTISIHSLRMEGDRVDPQNRWHPVISIHSLRMEGDVLR